MLSSSFFFSTGTKHPRHFNAFAKFLKHCIIMASIDAHCNNKNRGVLFDIYVDI